METKPVNPANRPSTPAVERKRIPMSVPVRKLEIADIPGYHLHWFRDEAGRIAQAQRAGYEFVTPEEAHVNSTALGSVGAASGNTDLGSQVSIVGGGVHENGQPVRMILMKLKEEYWKADQAVLEERNDQVANALTAGIVGGNQASDRNEQNMRYVGSRSKLPDMFNKNKTRLR